MVKTFIQNVEGQIISFKFKTVSDSAITRAINEVQSELGRISRRLIKLHGERDSLRAKIETSEKEQAIIQKKLAVFGSEEFKRWLKEQEREQELKKRDEMMAYAKADDFLRRHVGDKIYGQLVRKGEIVFKGGENRIFKITQYGQVSQSRGGEFQPVCVIRPKLPIPEQILAILTTLREEPNRILREQRRRR